MEQSIKGKRYLIHNINIDEISFKTFDEKISMRLGESKYLDEVLI